MTAGPQWLLLLMVRHRSAAALLALAIIFLLGTQVRPPVFAGSMIDEIDAGNPVLERAALVSAARGNAETIVVLMDPGDSSIGATIASLTKLRAELEQISPEVSLRSLESLVGQMIVYGLGPDDTARELLVALREDVASTIVSRDARLFAAIVLAPADVDDSVVAFLDQYVPGGGLVQVGVLAGAALERDVAAGLRADLRKLIPLIVVSMLAVLWAAFGHWRALLLPVFATVASTVVVFSLLSFAEMTINLVTLLALPIVLIVALANSCHFLAKSSAALETTSERAAAVVDTLHKVSVPYLISCLTTAVALASLAFNDIGPIRDLGILASLALGVSFILIIMAAPWTLFHYLGAPGAPMRETRIYRGFSAGVARWRRSLSVGFLMVAAAGAAVAPTLEVHSDARVFFPDSAAFTGAFTLFEDSFYAFSPVRAVVRGNDPGTAAIDVLRYAGGLRDRLAELPGVLEVLLTPAATEGRFLLTAMLDDAAAADGAVALLEDAPAPGFEVVYSSPQLVYEAIDQQALASLSESLGVSVLIILGSIVLLFRSALILAATIIANLVPLLLVCLAIWAMGEPLNLVTAFVFLVALGVIVDDTIHLLYRRRMGEPISGSSIEFSVVLTTIMLCTGLLLCQLSDFPTTRQFAAYFALALSTAVLSDLTVLPWINRRNEPAAAAA